MFRLDGGEFHNSITQTTAIMIWTGQEHNKKTRSH